MTAAALAALGLMLVAVAWTGTARASVRASAAAPTDPYLRRAIVNNLPGAVPPLDWRGWAVAPSLRDGAERLAARVHRAGGRLFISPAPGAIGRQAGAATTQHNSDRWGEVRAVDLMVEGVKLADAVAMARGLGLFSGIGAYPDWRPSPGLHVDVRADRVATDPALWGAVNLGAGQTYTTLAAALDRAAVVEGVA
jgi:hypothetical protein